MAYGYAGKLLRIDLGRGEAAPESLEEAVLRKYVGGASLGIRYVYDEVPPGVEWSDPENRLFIGSGPLGGTKIGGSGAISVVTKGSLTNGMASTQANGFFGAFLRFAGFDGLIVQGAAPNWVYLYIHDGKAELRDASHLAGKNTFEVDQLIKQELGKRAREASVMCIGPAGENLVRFACLCADGGHMAAHNGVGAVMGSKRLKAIAVDRGTSPVQIKDRETLSRVAKEMLANTLSNPHYRTIYAEGTVGGVVLGTKAGFVPVKNYTTSVHAIDPQKLEAYSSESIRRRFKAKRAPCWACSSSHCQTLEIAEGKYSGRVVDEPEYEGMAAFSSLVGIDDVAATVVLASEVDRLGMDCNEAGWVIAWVLECYEKGILTKKDTHGLEMTWGNFEAIMAMLGKIARREGFGDLMAEGVMRAARRIGGDAPDLAVHTMKGNTPRGHDHRAANWQELFDTCVSGVGTIEAHSRVPYRLLGMSADYDTFDHETISTVDARIKGVMIFEDSLVTCYFQTLSALDLLCQAVNAATGWDMGIEEAVIVGRRAVNLARAFNLRHGIGPELDVPSARYGSPPPDGPWAGQSIASRWPEMLRNYYGLMGWELETGKPLPRTLSGLGLDSVIPQLWPRAEEDQLPASIRSVRARPSLEV